MFNRTSILVVALVLVQSTIALCQPLLVVPKNDAWRHGAYGRNQGAGVTYGLIGVGGGQEEHLYSYPKVDIPDITKVKSIQLFRVKKGGAPEAVTIVIAGADLQNVKNWGGTTNDGAELNIPGNPKVQLTGRHSPNVKLNEDAPFDRNLNNNPLRERNLGKWQNDKITELLVEGHRTALAQYDYYWEVIDNNGKKTPNVPIPAALGPAKAER